MPCCRSNNQQPPPTTGTTNQSAHRLREPSAICLQDSLVRFFEAMRQGAASTRRDPTADDEQHERSATWRAEDLGMSAEQWGAMAYPPEGSTAAEYLRTACGIGPGQAGGGGEVDPLQAWLTEQAGEAEYWAVRKRRTVPQQPPSPARDALTELQRLLRVLAQEEDLHRNRLGGAQQGYRSSNTARYDNSWGRSDGGTSRGERGPQGRGGGAWGWQGRGGSSGRWRNDDEVGYQGVPANRRP